MLDLRGNGVKNVSRTYVKKRIKENGVFKGYMAPDQVNSFHILRGWHLGCEVALHSMEEMTQAENEFSYYNCNDRETGLRIRYWIRVKQS